MCLLNFLYFLDRWGQIVLNKSKTYKNNLRNNYYRMELLIKWQELIGMKQFHIIYDLSVFLYWITLPLLEIFFIKTVYVLLVMMGRTVVPSYGSSCPIQCVFVVQHAATGSEDSLDFEEQTYHVGDFVYIESRFVLP